jgi:hypothetical protein
MFTLPDISDIDAAIAREKFLLRGANFINSSDELSNKAHFELGEEIKVINERIARFIQFKELVQNILDLGFPSSPKNFASKEIIAEFQQLLGLAKATVDDFVISPSTDVSVSIVSRLK